VACPAWEEEESKKPPSLRQAYPRQAAPALAGQIIGASLARSPLLENAWRSLPQCCSNWPDFCSNRSRVCFALWAIADAAALLLASPWAFALKLAAGALRDRPLPLCVQLLLSALAIAAQH
jgi:hypothetical protein